MIRLAGAQTLFRKEILRFWNVGFQTVAAPVLTAVLYLLIFGHVLEDHVQVYPGVRYTSFLIPGLVMMSVRREPPKLPVRRIRSQRAQQGTSSRPHPTTGSTHASGAATGPTRGESGCHEPR